MTALRVPSPPEGTVDLFHRTTASAAQQIYATGTWTTLENTGEVYVSTRTGEHPDDQNAAYGVAVVWVQVPVGWAELEDEFPSGEQHYRLPIRNLTIAHVHGWGQDGHWVDTR